MILRRVTAVVGLFVGFMVMVATVFKIQHYPGASIMMIVGLTFFASFFIPLYFISRFAEEKNTIARVANILAILTLSPMAMGILFKIQHYPGASIMLLLGSLGFCFVCLPLFLIASFKSKKTILSFLNVILGLFMVSTWLILQGYYSPSFDLVRKVVFVDDELNYVTNSLELSVNKKLDKIIGNGVSTEDKQRLETLYGTRAEIISLLSVFENGIIEQSGGNLTGESKKSHADVAGLKNSDVPIIYLLSNDRLGALGNLLQQFQTTYDTYTMSTASVASISLMELYPAHHNSKDRWGMEYFDRTPVFLTLPMLAAIKARVLRMEDSVLNSYLDK